MSGYWGILFVILWPFTVYSQSDTTKFELRILYGSENNRIYFCSDSVAAAPDILIEGNAFDEPSEGLRVSISNYKPGEDLLEYRGEIALKTNWNAQYGYLELTGQGTAAEYTRAIKQVYYKNLSAVPTTGDRNVTVTLRDADFLPFTGHFYKYIPKLDITWTEARDSAARMTYNGLKGYLATITSTEENDFIWSKIDGIGWIGASDADLEGEWKWVTGPEAGTVFWRGGISGTRVNGQYCNWATGEPNNAGDEDYAHVNQNPQKEQKSWNDLENAGDGPNSQYYRARGFIVEFGGLSGDPELHLSASTVISVEKIAFSNQRDFTICAGEKIQLNQISLSEGVEYQYSWLPEQGLNNSAIYNPVASPSSTTVYTAQGSYGSCTSSAEFMVRVIPLPVSLLENEYVICEGNTQVLNPGIHESVVWEYFPGDQVITVSAAGWYHVELTDTAGCKTKDSTLIKWSIKPQLDLTDWDTLVCGAKQSNPQIKFTSGNASVQVYALNPGADVNNGNTLDPVLVADQFGDYPFRIDMTDRYGCNFSDTVITGFHHQPVARFQMDEAECEGYNLKLDFRGETAEEALFRWYSSDTLYAEGNNLVSMEIPLGFGRSNRSVELVVNEQGCLDSLKIPVTVTPVLDFGVLQNEGCTPLHAQFDYTSSEPVKSFLWNFGDGEGSSQDKPSHQYLNPGILDLTFDVELTVVSAEGCTNTGIKREMITIHPIPTADLNVDSNTCYGDTIAVFYEGSAGDEDRFFWDLGGLSEKEVVQSPGNTKGPLIIAPVDHPVSAIGVQVISQYGCKSESLVKSVLRKPQFRVTPDFYSGCPPLSVLFSAETSDAADQVNYLWEAEISGTVEGPVFTAVFSEPDIRTTLTVVANSTLTGCSDTMILQDVVEVFQVPEAAFLANPSVVVISNPVIRFENQSVNATEYTWMFDDGSLSSDEKDPVHRFPEMGFYQVSLTAKNELGCADTVLQEVAVSFDRVFPPNAFSPNAPREEDREFRIHSEGIAEEGFQLQIYNRWGELIFESGSQEEGWDGKTKNGKYSPSGVYTWIVSFLDFRGEKYNQKGTVTLLY